MAHSGFFFTGFPPQWAAAVGVDPKGDFSTSENQLFTAMSDHE